MEIARLDPDDTPAVEELFALQRAVHAADTPDNPPPLRDELLVSVRQTSPEGRSQRLLARVDGRLVGVAVLRLPDIDNRHLAQAEVQVSPEHRRRGVGRALLERTRQQARAERRSTLGCWGFRSVPGGPPRGEAGIRFLAAMGFSPAFEGTMRRIDLSHLDEAAEQRLLDECLPYASEYEFHGWTGLTPDELADDSAYLFNRLNTDAPTGDVDMEPTTMDAERLHADERLRLDRHVQLVGAAARHRTTGEVAAISTVHVRAAGDSGIIAVTIADPKHRGHRLGTIVKIELHRRVRRAFPELRYVRTGNADTNVHMVGINERLGYVPYEGGTFYQLTL